MSDTLRDDTFAHTIDSFVTVGHDVANPVTSAPIDTLQVVFKVAERCNIDCSYCYYFNMGESSALGRPPFVNLARTKAIAAWIARGCRELAIPKVLVSFHGGEPMMLKPALFDAVCASLRDAITPHASLAFSIQTNGTILSDMWLDLFRAHVVHVGVSIDGDRPAHDRFRRDKRARSTFNAVSGNLQRLVQWGESDSRLGPSTISVLDWRNDYKAIYRYLRNLGVRDMSYLLPDRNLDDGFPSASESAHQYGTALFDIFQAWLTEDDPKVFVRQINNALRHFQLVANGAASSACTSAAAPGAGKRIQIVIIHSDGTVAVNDSFMPALAWYSTLPRHSVESCTLAGFLAELGSTGIDDIPAPAVCRTCRWGGLCRGGDIENRFSRRNGFDNPSLYCEGYKFFFSHMCELLTRNGYPADLLEDRLQQAKPKAWFSGPIA